ncbi:hypothetical protein KO02_22595 [Sphingobacterium sp. ML3W]|uniref:O-antigen ligase family protein n=1 Tax=Sphingobacterium sp. ML3W TaxID=1538644 RepID=UPI0004F901FF|nr:O-antigen ligase family protein [Sphingobacterium sp. ML3W]AIM39158.1 hypothetical protein KO02_22595 [Sphingobacterium sp. ML3W]
MENRKFYLLVLIGTIIQLLFYLGTNTYVFSILGIGVLFGASLFLRPFEALCIFSFLLSNQRIIVLNQGSASLLNLVVFILIFRLLSANKYYLQSRIIINAIAILVYSSLLIFIHEDTSLLVTSFKFLITVSLFFYMGNQILKEDRYTSIKLLNSYICGAVCAGVLGVIFEGVNLGTERFSAGDYNNSNILGTSFSFALTLLVVLFNRKKQSLKLTLLLGLPLLFFGFLTQSRSFLLAIAILALYLIISNFSVKGIIVSVVSLGLIFLLKDVLNLTFLNRIFDNAIMRVLEPKNDDLSGGRTELWIGYLNQFFSDTKTLFFGKGFELTHEKYGFPQVAHNFIIETVAAMGVIGLVLYITLFSGFYFNIKKNFSLRNIPLELFIPLFVLLSNNMTGHSFINIGFSFQFVLWVILIGFCQSTFKKEISITEKL